MNTVRDIAKYNSGSDMTTVVNHLIYDAFGKVTSESNPATGDIFYSDNWPSLVGNSLFLFTGRPFDSDTQLQNNLNRWYDASVGRWLSKDPIGFAGGDGNLYRYVKNDPLEALDPDGNVVRGVIIGGGFSFAVGGCVYVYSVSDPLGNAAIILARRLGVGVELSIGAQGFISQGTVSEFLKGFSVDISGGVGVIWGQVGLNPHSGWGCGVRISVPWVPHWIFKVGISGGVTAVVHGIWKNF
ncbi:MAG: RHS repeat-associated core domain-containing protein [Thermogutta sp.]|uniref:RHS repeat-associated core domain-containing protein n=1 Tax=Thermogutta sp. TaxID=1962930 RepID=UPI0019B4A09D|nr:RHS repeat-associated core domain-containing protein [Thermogutta sp.]MBC7352834.1 RHS repeat-associated core domain-containing protein [Thermogutta sp.]